jgi:hypothetical protein
VKLDILEHEIFKKWCLAQSLNEGTMKELKTPTYWLEVGKKCV